MFILLKLFITTMTVYITWYLVLLMPSAHRATQLSHIVLSPEVFSASSHDIPITFRSSSMVALQFFQDLPLFLCPTWRAGWFFSILYTWPSHLNRFLPFRLFQVFASLLNLWSFVSKWFLKSFPKVAFSFPSFILISLPQLLSLDTTLPR